MVQEAHLGEHGRSVWAGYASKIIVCRSLVIRFWRHRLNTSAGFVFKNVISRLSFLPSKKRPQIEKTAKASALVLLPSRGMQRRQRPSWRVIRRPCPSFRATLRLIGQSSPQWDQLDLLNTESLHVRTEGCLGQSPRLWLENVFQEPKTEPQSQKKSHEQHQIIFWTIRGGYRSFTH